MASATPDLYGYLPSHRASPPFGWYHILLFGKKYNVVPAKGRRCSMTGKVWCRTGHASQTQWYISTFRLNRPSQWPIDKGDEHPLQWSITAS